MTTNDVPPPSDDDVLTATEVAQWLRLSVEQVRRLHRVEKLRSVRGSARLRFSRGSVRAFIHER